MVLHKRDEAWPSDGSYSVFRSFLNGRKPGKMEAVAAGFVAAQAIAGLVKKWKAERIERDTVVLKFTEGTEEYRWLVAWLSKQPRIEDAAGRQFCAKHLGSNRDGCISVRSGQADERDPKEASRWALVPDSIAAFKFEGLTIKISRGEPQKNEDRMLLSREVVVSCVTRDMSAIERLLASIYEIGNEAISGKPVPRVHALNSWGEWEFVRNAPLNRSPILPDGVMDSLRSDLSWFLSNEDWYHGVGVPYRRGYLLHGIPGSGKTTTAVSLAAEFNKNVYIMPLSGMDDGRLMRAINSVGGDSILLLEDIDCISITNDRDAASATESQKLTLQGILNALDGVTSKDGRVMIATTNRREVLDRALIRPGRFDREFEFASADYNQIAELCRRFGIHEGEDEIAREWHAEGVSMATVQKRLLEKCGINNG